ncbi:triosephosphate isomerase [Microbacterium endophyticum]|uniref:Triosephosphate isomerase n=1 Tax=Microbacterium endophyticum TaxID=1526412 RepID=A0A7W4V2V7_9MICO|nr:triose-phosphate isomerase family protein [Microbacterium endophyticum]MBB2975837.1 triosephosphate isomerase [Microbacterium endophyticum]NIK36320.1 triosephosphate isomerase [Microbacterium endophyticum]
MGQVTVGVSLKTYFGRAEALAWFEQVAARIRLHEAVRTGSVEVFVIPTYLQIDDAVRTFTDTAIKIGAQDVSEYPPGAFTGEVSATELVESGVEVAEIGHAERRRLFAETDAVVAAKTKAALSEGITPVLCLGETEHLSPADAAATTVAQLHSAIAGAAAGPLIVAYEPVWAIGAPEPAPAHHIGAVTTALRAALDALDGRDGSAVIYGGSAGPGLLTALDGAADGLFLGRFAHNPDAFVAVLDEAASLAAARSRP